MQQRIKTALVPATVLVTLALGAAQLATADAETPPKRRDELSAKRPAAAAQLAETAPYGIAQAVQETAVNGLVVDIAKKIQSDLQAAELAQQQSPRSSGSSTGSSGGSAYSNPGDFLACTRAHESDSAGGYGAVSPGGTYRGAYQFHQGTWNSTAAHAGRSDLVGADPASVAPGDQDAMAAHLYGWQGSAPWGGAC